MGNVLTLGGENKPGYYTITYSDEKYADAQAEVLVESNLKEGSITVEDNALKVADNEDGITAADLAANISGVVINGEPLGSRNPGAVVMNEDGASIWMRA